MTAIETITRLRDNLDKLSLRNRAFADSLLSQLDGPRSRGLSEKQMSWVEKLGARAVGADKPASHDVGNVVKIVELLEFAHQHLKRPAIVMGGDKLAVRVNIAGERARVPGSLTLTSAERDDAEGRAWYGRITKEGEFQPSGKLQAEDVTELAAMLKTFADDPAKAASEYGRLHGACCFCRLPLKDERSTAVGYGKTCARHFGLPWGRDTDWLKQQAGGK